jgi:hypothetical protein
MHLTKEDIEHVGYHRYRKAHSKETVIVLACLMVALLAGGFGLIHLYPDNEWAILWVGVPIMILAIVWLAIDGKAQQKSVLELEKQCDLDPNLLYVGDKDEPG